MTSRSPIGEPAKKRLQRTRLAGVRCALRSVAVPLVAGVLALAAVGVVLLLQAHANTSRDNQVKLATVKDQLNGIQQIPWTANPKQGASATDSAAELDAGEAMLTSTLDRLNRSAPTPQLFEASAHVSNNFSGLANMLQFVALGDLAGAAQAATPPEHELKLAVRLLAAAGIEYRNQANTALFEAGVGSASAIMTLLVGFGFMYRRSRRARARAQLLASENERLLAVSRVEALVDALTGLPNRRALMNDLQARSAAGDGRLVLALLDLNGFKEYNDNFGHAAGDALLARLGDRLATTLEGIGTAYRMGGDEFCVLAELDDDGGALARLAAAALSEDGDAFRIDCAHGVAPLNSAAASFEDALLLADQRMYEQKSFGRSSASRQSADVLLTVLGERSRELEAHIADVAQLAQLTAERLGLPEAEVKRVRLAAELHDVGKTAIPDAILNKPGKLDDDEWAFMRRHTLIGARIIGAAPSLAQTAELVRASHERFDGHGYPDGLHGDQIPLGARIIAVCDAFDAMVSDRPYRRAQPVSLALAELRRCAQIQFDQRIVDAFCDMIAERSLRERQLAAENQLAAA